MRQVNPKVYSKEYYLNSCLGFEEFKKSKGRKVHPRINNFSRRIRIKKGMYILDLGCGRGDMAIELAKKGARVIGVDYSKDGIRLAKANLKNQQKTVQKRVSFFVMDAKKLRFRDNTFDAITSVDVFEHLYKEELELAMREISRVLKPKGTLLVHTETNKIYLDITHRVWSYPIDRILVVINNLLTKRNYPGLPKDPRNDLHKKQHVNEPTYFYLKNLFSRHKFEGKIESIVPLKPHISWKDTIHNRVVSLFPISQYFPLHVFFAHDYFCLMKNKKNKR